MTIIEVTGRPCPHCGSTAQNCYEVLCLADAPCCDRCDGHEDA